MIRYFVIVLIVIISPFAVLSQTPDNYKSLLANNQVMIDSTNLPIIFIDVNGDVIKRDNYILAKMKIIHNDDKFNYQDTILHPNQNVDYEGYIALRYRGNTSFSLSNKKPYLFRTLENNILPNNGGKKKKVSILGMGKDNKWAILAPWADRSMIRDVLSFELGRPWFDFVPQTRFCEIILDGTYYGVYIITECVSKGKERLDLHSPGDDGDDIQGDILVYINRDNEPHYKSRFHPENERGIQMDKFIKYQYKLPDADDLQSLSYDMKNAIDEEIDKMESSFVTDYWMDPERGYRAYIDVNSFIDYMLATELSFNIDGYRLSTYLYKYSKIHAEMKGVDSRWKMSLWDMNLAWGNHLRFGYNDFRGWQYNINSFQSFEADTEWVPFYWKKLLQDPTYINQMKQRWQLYRLSNHSNERLFATVDSLTSQLTKGGAVLRNNTAWDIFNQNIRPETYRVNDYEEEIGVIKKWIEGRLLYMDKAFLGNATIIEYNNQSNKFPSQAFSIRGVKWSKSQKGIKISVKTDGSRVKSVVK